MTGTASSCAGFPRNCRRRPGAAQSPLVNAREDPPPVRRCTWYTGAVKAVAACAGAGYLTAMPLSGTGRLTAWAAVTAVLLACCAVIAVRGGRPQEEQEEDCDE